MADKTIVTLQGLLDKVLSEDDSDYLRAALSLLGEVVYGSRGDEAGGRGEA